MKHWLSHGKSNTALFGQTDRKRAPGLAAAQRRATLPCLGIRGQGHNMCAGDLDDTRPPRLSLQQWERSPHARMGCSTAAQQLEAKQQRTQRAVVVVASANGARLSDLPRVGIKLPVRSLNPHGVEVSLFRANQDEVDHAADVLC